MPDAGGMSAKGWPMRASAVGRRSEKSSQATANAAAPARAKAAARRSQRRSTIFQGRKVRMRSRASVRQRHEQVDDGSHDGGRQQQAGRQRQAGQHPARAEQGAGAADQAVQGPAVRPRAADNVRGHGAILRWRRRHTDEGRRSGSRGRLFGEVCPSHSGCGRQRVAGNLGGDQVGPRRSKSIRRRPREVVNDPTDEVILSPRAVSG